MKYLTRFLLIALATISARAADTPVPVTSLPAIVTVGSGTVLPVVDVAGTPTTKKATVAQLVTGLPAATVSTNGTMSAVDKATLAGATNAATPSTLVLRNASGNFAGNVITANSVTGLGPPTNDSDAATKSYVDAAAAGLVIKTPAKAGTTGSNITLSGGAPTTLDGVTLALNDRVLVKDQTDAKQNGIYYVSTLGTGSDGTWQRTPDADTGAELVTGSYVFLTGGSVNANAAYTMVTPGTITIGVSDITWNLFSQVTQILASNIIGQIVASQVQDGAINTAKFALGLTPVELLASLPVSGNFEGRQVFLTTNGKLYRYTGGAFTAAVAAVDLTGQVSNTQIADNAISTPKLQANSVTAAAIAANSIQAGDLQANAVTAGTIAAGAVNTTELAAGAVNASKIAAGSITTSQIAANTIQAGNIQAGTITADRLNISQLSAITANIGTITSGSLTASSSVTVGTGTAAVSLTSSGLSIAGGRVNLAGDGSNPWVRVYGTGGFSSSYVELNGQNGAVSALFNAVSGSNSVLIGGGGMAVNGTGGISLGSGTYIAGPGALKSIWGDGDAINFVFGESPSAGSAGGYLSIKVNGRQVLVPFNNP